MDHDVHGVEEREPRMRTLIYFGLGLMVTIVSIIVIAALLGT
jgi:hypothetical protein